MSRAERPGSYGSFPKASIPTFSAPGTDGLGTPTSPGITGEGGSFNVYTNTLRATPMGSRAERVGTHSSLSLEGAHSPTSKEVASWS